jgi:hypothetical protein
VSEHVRLCWHMQCPRWHVSEVVALRQCMQLHPPPNPIFHSGAPNALTRSSLWDSDWSTSRLWFFFSSPLFFSFLNFYTHSSKIARWTIILCFISNLIIVLFIVIYFVLGPFFNWFLFFLILSFNIWLVEN